MDKNAGFLTIDGDRIVDPEGSEVILRGVGIGGWMTMENFITGFPANEEAMRDELREALGEAGYARFSEGHLESFFAEEDLRFISSIGLNSIRVPLNYRYFEDDLQPFHLKEDGFRHLDHIIELCHQYGIYVIIDLHAAPGYQNQDWHCDNPTHKAFLWQHRHFQDRVVWLWEIIADRYKDRPQVAGYNPLNEPADPSETRLVPFYDRLIEAIRSIDPNHILFIDGNRYSNDCHLLPEPWPNTIYSIHDYALPGLIDGGPYPGLSRGKYVDRGVLEEILLEKIAPIRQHGIPIWVGEFGPVYKGNPEADEMRYQVLRDQLEIYAHYSLSWSLWTHKDIGLQGLVYASPESAWVMRIKPLLEKKSRLGADSWGSTDEAIGHIIQPIMQTMAREFPDYDPFPFGIRWQIRRLVRNILLAEPLLEDLGDLMRGSGEDEIDKLMKSFSFESCVHREALVEVLRDHLKGS
jgi:endoglucanase